MDGFEQRVRGMPIRAILPTPETGKKCQMTEPAPCGIPNSIGNTCWFQACTQCLFRDAEIRDAIFAFAPEALQIAQGPETLAAFRAVLEHFTQLRDHSGSVSNRRLVQLLRDRQNRALVTEATTSGRDSYFALEAYADLFAVLLGDRALGVHTLNPPFGCVQSLRRGGPKSALAAQIYVTVDDAPDVQAAVLPLLDQLFFLPRVLIVRHDRASPALTHPDPLLELPEPFDWIASGRDLAKAKTRVKFGLFAMVCYTGSNCDHAIAFVKVSASGKWFYCNDQTVEERGDDACLKDPRMLSPDFVWPALFFYRKQ
jgi:hypothetical protein